MVLRRPFGHRLSEGVIFFFTSSDVELIPLTIGIALHSPNFKDDNKKETHYCTISKQVH